MSQKKVKPVDPLQQRIYRLDHVTSAGNEALTDAVIALANIEYEKLFVMKERNRLLRMLIDKPSAVDQIMKAQKPLKGK